MAELTFAQPERRSFLVPGLIVLAVVAVAFALIYRFTPHRIADLAVTHTVTLPMHTVFKTDSKILGAEGQAQDDFYVLTTLRIDDKLRLPLFIKDITATLNTPAGDLSTSAIEKRDLDNLYITFPALKPLATSPLLRETAIQPGEHAEGMVLLHFPIAQTAWDQRSSATVTVDFYHQGPLTVTIPKP